MAVILTAITIVSTILALIAGFVYILFKCNYSYWDKKKVPHTKPTFPLGDLNFKKSLSQVCKDIYNVAPEKPFCGFWFMHKPYLMVNDPELIRRVLVQDFQSFPDHGNYVNEKDDPLNAHLFSMTGQRWRNLRANLSPTFTSGKMKSMFPIFESISKTMLEVLEPIADKGGVIDVKDVVGCYTTDIIASCAFGIETDSLRNPDHIFRQMGKRIFMPTWSNMLRNLTGFLMPDIARMIKLVQTDKQVSKFFLDVVRETIEYREHNSVQRNDVMQVLIQLKNKGFVANVDKKGDDAGDTFTSEMAAANAFIFFLGGFETVSGTSQFILYELAKNQEMQDRLRDQIMKELELSDGQMTYEGLARMKYLGMIIEESLRKYPAAPILFREAGRDYEIPGTDITIEKGTPVYVSAVGLHHDTRYYTNPDVFDPERFSEGEKAKRHHYVYLPFGEGPRFCIGQRFAELQMKAGLFSLISKYKFYFCEKTPEKIELDPHSFVTTPIGGMQLKITHV